MIHSMKVDKILYGGDYNPEQWTPDIWKEDMRMFKLAHIDIVTLNVFNWAALQSDEETYHFEQLDKIMDMVRENGLKVCLATSTAAHPAWMARKYPDILRTESGGRKRKFGGRHNSCPNSPTYQKYAKALAVRLAERYKHYDNIVAWHISNEYGGECYCDNCEKAFRVWLQNKYKTIQQLNIVWNTAFWGHTFYDWEDVVLPDMRSEHFDYDRTMFQGISLDYRRFMSDSILENYKAEYRAIKEITPDIPITTNFMGFYKLLDYQKWAKYIDFISWDNYPDSTDDYAHIAFSHDLMRGVKGSQPFALMEQTPSVTNWQEYNALKRPGVMRLWSYQALAHGADTVMFFQLRRSIGECEKFHGAVIAHVGNEHTRVFKEITQLGMELGQIGAKTLGTKTNAKVAIMVDWDNWWAVEYSAGPSRLLKYIPEVERYYSALRALNIDVDLISVEDDLSKYQLVIAPLMYMVKGNNDNTIREYVKNGGRFVTSFFSGIVEEHDLVTTGGYPGKLKDILGIWVEESDALPEGKVNLFEYREKEYQASLLCDIIHLRGANSMGAYTTDFYKGSPAVTEHEFGMGRSYYVATAATQKFYIEFLGEICQEMHILSVLDVPDGVEVTSRGNEIYKYVFVLNHNDEEKTINIPWKCTEIIRNRQYNHDKIVLLAKDTMILQIIGKDCEGH